MFFKLRKPTKQKSRILIEQLEPRILFSAEPFLGVGGGLIALDTIESDISQDRLIAQDAIAGQHFIDSHSNQNTESSQFTSVAFVDLSITGVEQLLATLDQQGVAIELIEQGEDGVQFISNRLQSYTGLDSVQVFSHGSQEGLTLGNSVLSLTTLPTYADTISTWEGSLSGNADILLFGCDLAGSDSGLALLDSLAQITGADIAASTDATGHADFAANWILEVNTGPIETETVAIDTLDDWTGLLASIVVTTTNDIVDAPDLLTLSALSLNVGIDGEISLREAITVANNDSSVDLITLGSGNYQLTLVGIDDANASGDLDLAGTYTLQGAGAALTQITQTTADGVVHINSGDVTITNLEVTGGNSSNVGGGIRIESGSTFTMSDALVSNNDSSDDGGGVHVDGTATLTDVVISGNTSDKKGGGVGVGVFNNSSQLTLERVTISNNNSSDEGGGIYNDGILSATDVEISNNATTHGGGISNEYIATLERVTIHTNVASNEGGGVYQTFAAVSVSMSNVTISGNQADKGGGISADDSVIISNSTIVNNTDQNEAGGMWVGPATTMQNSVLANNVSINKPANNDANGNFASLGFNLIESVGAGVTPLSSDITGLDPALSALGIGTGYVQTHTPLTGSPLINSGSANATAMDANYAPSNEIPDIGAHEVTTAGGVLFWTDGVDSIYRSTDDGLFVQTVLTGLDAPLDVEVDEDSSRIYWLEKNSHEIKSSLLDGSDIQSHFVANAGAVAFALDVAADHVYITSTGFPPIIERYLLSGGSSSTLHSLSDLPSDIEIDVAENRLYWADSAVFLASSINTALTSDSSYTTLAINPDVDRPIALAIDESSNDVFWVDQVNQEIGAYYESAGNSILTVAPSPLQSVSGIAFDSLNDRLFMTTGADGTILTSDVGLSSQSVFIGSLSTPTAIAYFATSGTAPTTDAAPLLAIAPGVAVTEGLSTTLLTSHLTASDVDTADTALIYTVTGTVSGQVMIGGSPVTSFTNQQLIDGDVSFGHDGSEPANGASITLYLSDATTSLAAGTLSFAVTATDDAPALTIAPSVAVTEGLSTTLLTSHLNASDVDTADSDLIYTVTGTVSGQVMIGGSPVTSFTSQQLIDGDVSFGHDGSEPASGASITLYLSDATTSLAAGTLSFAVTATDDAPALTIAPSVAMTEGLSTTLLTSHLNASDVDTADSDLIYTVTGTVSGQVMIGGSPVTSFTSQQLIDGDVSFGHDGSEPASGASITLYLSDATTSLAAGTLSFAVTATDDAPALTIAPSVAMTEGLSTTLLTSHLNASDVDTADSDLIYTVTGTVSGQVMIGGSPVTSFTSQQLIDGDVSFGHDGSEPASGASITLYLSDATTSLAAGTLSFAVTATDDAPALTIAPSVAMTEGLSTTLLTSHLNASDVDTADSDLIYTVTGTVSGQVMIGGSPVTSFTSQQLIDGDVSFGHDGSEPASGASITLYLSDATTSLAAGTLSFAVTATDDAPALTIAPSVAMTEGLSTTLLTSHLNASDVDTADSDLIYTVTGTVSGQVMIGGSPVTSFTSQQLIDGDVSFGHDGSEPASGASITLYLSDATTSLAAGTLSFAVTATDDAPALTIAPSVAMTEGLSTTLLTSHLNASDVDTADSDLIYTVTGTVSGQVMIGGSPVTSFTSQQLIDGDVSFGHDGSEPASGASITLYLSDATTSLAAGTLSFAVTATDDAPALTIAPSVAVTEGLSTTLLTSHLNASDVDTADSDLIYTVTGTVSGQVMIGGSPVTSFTSQQLIDGDVSFGHDGSEPANGASITLYLSDATTSLAAGTLSFGVTPINDSVPVAKSESLSGSRGEGLTTLDSGSSSLLDGASDADLPIDLLTASLVSAPAHGAITLNSDGSFLYQHDGSETFLDSFTYVVVDAAGNSSNLAVVSIVVDGNSTPVATGVIPTQYATETNTFLLALDSSLFSDPDADDTLTLSITQIGGMSLPSWLQFDSVNSTLSGTPSDSDVGSLMLEVIAQDSNGASSNPITVELIVTDINQAPQLSLAPSFTIPENAQGAILGTLISSDPDASDTVALSVDDSRFIVDGNTLKLQTSIALDHEVQDSMQISVLATDVAGLSSSQIIEVNVEDVNDTPIVSETFVTQALKSGSLVSIPENLFSDQDGDHLIYSVTLINGDELPQWIEFDSINGQLQIRVVPESVALIELSLSADDGRGGTAATDIELHFEPPLISAMPVEEEPVFEFSQVIEQSSLTLLNETSSNAHQSKDSSIDVVSKKKEYENNEKFGIIEPEKIDIAGLLGPLPKYQGVQIEVLEYKHNSVNRGVSKTILINPLDSMSMADIMSSAKLRDATTFSSLANEFERLHDELDSDENFSRGLIGSSVTLTSGLSVGYIFYIIRGGTLLGSMLSSLPAWRFVDPLPILSSFEDSAEMDEESLESIVQEGSEQASYPKDIQHQNANTTGHQT